MTYAAIFGTNILANNGGPTQTIALIASSPAINAGSNALAVDANNQPLTTVQRGAGFNRFSGTVDIGAFEVQNTAPTAVSVTPSTASLDENTSTATRVKVADITITDDGNGTNVLSLTGVDADQFEIDGLELFIKAGTVLDFETQSSYSVTIEVDDSTLGTNPDATTPFTLNLNDLDEIPPTATVVVADSSLIIGETSLVTITFSEAVTGFTNADLTVVNGTLSAVSSSDSGVTWTATFTPTASVIDSTNVITLNNAGVTDLPGNAGTGTTISPNCSVDTAAPGTVLLLPDPDHPSQTILAVTGSSGNDKIAITKTKTGSYLVNFNGVRSTFSLTNSRILVRGLAGDDTISVANNIVLSSELDGGTGLDKITGGGGRDLILGGEGADALYGVGGNDTLTASGSRSILIGGSSLDSLKAGSSGDLLIGGTTDFDTDTSALTALRAEWAATTPVLSRIDHLSGAVSGGLNGGNLLIRGSTVHDDSVVDTFTNSFADDWLFTNPGDIRTRITGRVVEEPWIVPRVWLDIGQVLLLPEVVVSALECVRVVDLNAEAKRQRAALMQGELCKRATAAGQDEHHCPVAVAERSLERLHVDVAGAGRIAGVGVNPDPAALFGAATEVDLLLEVLSHRDVVERDERLGTALTDELDFADQQQVIWASDAKRAAFGRADVTQEQQLGQGCWREPQARVRSRS